MGDDKAAWVEMWLRKDEGRGMFANAELVEDTEFRRWNGHGAKPEYTAYSHKAGTTVLITMVSRFGGVGIRVTNIDKEEHGYDARVDPEKLKSLKFLSDGGRPWRKEMMTESGDWKESEPKEEVDSGSERSFFPLLEIIQTTSSRSKRVKGTK